MELGEVLDSLQVVQLTLRTKFRGITTRELALINGPYGLGEFSPFLEYGAIESAPWLGCALEAAFTPPRALNRSLIKINGTIPAVDDPAEIRDLVGRYPGVEVFKIKVGSDLATDIARIETLVSILPAVKVRLDVNGAWSIASALSNIRAILDNFGSGRFEYVEQPVATIAELRQLKADLGDELKIAADEVLRKAKNPFEVDLSGAADLLVLKVAPLGGMTRALSLAAHHKLPVVVSSALDSAVGIGYGLRLAAALPTLDYAAGLGTGALFSEDLASLPIIDGAIAISEQVIDEGTIAKFIALPERLEWWRNRVRSCWEVLQ